MHVFILDKLVHGIMISRLAKSELMEPSFVEFSLNDISFLGKLCFEILDKFHLIKVSERRGMTVKCNNLTLLNLMLIVFGPVSEEMLTVRLLILQVIQLF